ncbi:NADPH-dependent diflavin oxidoreductase 1 [Lobulomyces angularis]|nr:NADPH-dependent diflavin oxidoreductase 1 [Lobulomyces angularis]
MDERKLLVLYGSETGCSQEIAERITREARRFLFKVVLSEMDLFEWQNNLLGYSLIIFTCSTTGQGDIPNNMKQFWKFLTKKSLPQNIFDHVQFAVFGLGDSSYQKYNFTAKKLFKRMQQLGAKPILNRGDGDDQNYLGVDQTFDPWVKELFELLLRIYPLKEEEKILPANELSNSTFSIQFLEGSEAENKLKAVPSQNQFFAEVSDNARITPQSHFQEVRTIEFKLPNEAPTYKPGDVMLLTPENLPDDVDEFIKFFNWEGIADKTFIIKQNFNDIHIPVHWENVLTIRKLLTKYLDIFGRPKRYFFELLSYFAKDENHVWKLKDFLLPSGQDELHNYCFRVKRTTFEVLQDFHSVKEFPIDYIFDLFPTIKPRSFSIASSPNFHPGAVQLLVAIVNYKTKLKKPRVGICTKWITTLKVGDKVPYRVTPGTFKLPPPPGACVILIGPGTGIAPMRSILHDRIKNEKKENILFFGGRNKSCDFFYQQEFESYVKNGNLNLHTAFSRDQDYKIYVQHRIKEISKLLWTKIGQEGAVVYLSGSSNRMPTDVSEALKEIFISEGKMSQEEADLYFTAMIKNFRFQQECWS